jgi:hypothetical protein
VPAVAGAGEASSSAPAKLDFPDPLRPLTTIRLGAGYKSSRAWRPMPRNPATEILVRNVGAVGVSRLSCAWSTTSASASSTASLTAASIPGSCSSMSKMTSWTDCSDWSALAAVGSSVIPIARLNYVGLTARPNRFAISCRWPVIRSASARSERGDHARTWGYCRIARNMRASLAIMR